MSSGVVPSGSTTLVFCSNLLELREIAPVYSAYSAGIFGVRHVVQRRVRYEITPQLNWIVQ